MSKLDLSTIIIVALCVFALGFLIWKTIGLNDSKQTTDNTTQIISPQNDAADDYEFDDEGEIIADDAAGTAANGRSDMTGEGSAANSSGANANGSSANNSTSTGSNNTSGSTTTTRETSPVGTTTSGGGNAASRPAPTFYDDDSRGQYLVLAGAFRIKDNGINEARRIRRMGYPDAEMTLMDRGTYATVLVDRFQSMSDAKELVSDLEAKGVECYVHRKR